MSENSGSFGARLPKPAKNLKLVASASKGKKVIIDGYTFKGETGDVEGVRLWAGLSLVFGPFDETPAVFLSPEDAREIGQTLLDWADNQEAAGEIASRGSFIGNCDEEA